MPRIKATPTEVASVRALMAAGITPGDLYSVAHQSVVDAPAVPAVPEVPEVPADVSLLHFEGEDGAGATTDETGNDVVMTSAVLYDTDPPFGVTGCLISDGGTVDVTLADAGAFLVGDTWTMTGVWLPAADNQGQLYVRDGAGNPALNIRLSLTGVNSRLRVYDDEAEVALELLGDSGAVAGTAYFWALVRSGGDYSFYFGAVADMTLPRIFTGTGPNPDSANPADHFVIEALFAEGVFDETLIRPSAFLGEASETSLPTPEVAFTLDEGTPGVPGSPETVEVTDPRIIRDALRQDAAFYERPAARRRGADGQVFYLGRPAP